MTHGLTPREPAKRLYEGLLDQASVVKVAGLVADGIHALIANIHRLLSDANVLSDAERFASASFLLATAEEELAKVFILLDACRLDWGRHSSVFRRLCRAFYDHIQKHAYNQLRRFPNINSMSHALAIWRIEVRRWWPGSENPEDADPSLAHATFFSREMPLYVDWDYTTATWWVPESYTNAEKFKNDLLPSDCARLQAEVGELCDASTKGLLSQDALEALNVIYAGTYVNDRTPNNAVCKLEHELVDHVAKHLSLLPEEVAKSALIQLPLYHFTTLPLDPIKDDAGWD